MDHVDYITGYPRILENYSRPLCNLFYSGKFNTNRRWATQNVYSGNVQLWVLTGSPIPNFKKKKKKKKFLSWFNLKHLTTCAGTIEQLETRISGDFIWVYIHIYRISRRLHIIILYFKVACNAFNVFSYRLMKTMIILVKNIFYGDWLFYKILQMWQLCLCGLRI